ncbi:MAG: glycosyltransferase family 87 protein [Anaerolineaceae bacterium]
MEVKSRRPFSNLKSWNWQNVILLALMAFSLTNFGFRVATEKFPYYGQDYLAFWSAGKIADTVGYLTIYELDSLRDVESEELIKLGVLESKEDTNFLTIPTPYLAIFVVPFQFLSRIEIQTSTTIWLIINFLTMIAYLLFFYRDLRFKEGVRFGGYFLLLFVLFSYPVFDNFLEGQINVFLMICVGEFIRNAAKNRAFASGIWLAGLLLKPQLLVIVIPLILLMGYWKTLKGFLSGSAIVLMSSWMLCGSKGLRDLFLLLTGYTQGIATSSPQSMINWRMIGVNLNSWTHSSFGWMVTLVGMLATLAAVVYLVKDHPILGSNEWLMSMVGVFSATLAVTWHAHNHMAMVMIPLLLTVSRSGLFSMKGLWIWVLTPVIAWVGAGLIGVVLLQFTAIEELNPMEIAIPIGAFIANLLVIVEVVRWKRNKKNKDCSAFLVDS